MGLPLLLMSQHRKQMSDLANAVHKTGDKQESNFARPVAVRELLS